MPNETPPAKPLKVFVETRVKPAAERAVYLFNARSVREKVMIILFAAVAVIFLDYWILIRPIVQVFGDTLPKLTVLEGQLQDQTKDKNNKPLILKQWSEAKDMLGEKEKSLIAPGELPALLENLSKLAQDSEVKILSLKPVEIPEAAKENHYREIPIQMNAVAGTHSLGQFLARLESGATFFRVKNLKITAGPTESNRQLLELSLECYGKVS